MSMCVNLRHPVNMGPRAPTMAVEDTTVSVDLATSEQTVRER